MSVHERILYESFAGAIELREDIVRRAGLALTRAVLIRNVSGFFATIAAAFQAAELFAPLPWPDYWSSARVTAVMLVLSGAWLLSAVSVWCCRQRVQDCRSRLIQYVARLPVDSQKLSPDLMYPVGNVSAIDATNSDHWNAHSHKALQAMAGRIVA